MPQASKTLPKKRPVPTKRSPPIRAVDTSAAPHSGRDDDVKIMALDLAPGKLSAQMKAYFKKCDEKLGFVPMSSRLSPSMTPSSGVRGLSAGARAERRQAIEAGN